MRFDHCCPSRGREYLEDVLNHEGDLKGVALIVRGAKLEHCHDSVLTDADETSVNTIGWSREMHRDLC